jgi:hypothetical protein
MLGKLIKHEFKAVNRLMIPLHLVLIAVTIVGRFYVQFAMQPSYTQYESVLNTWKNLIDVSLIFFYVIALIAVAIVSSLYLYVLRPRKNWFTDEGYLTHTLPVSAACHIWSKLIVSLVWGLADVMLVGLSIFCMFVNGDFLKEFGEICTRLLEAFPDVFGVSAAVGIPLYLLLTLVSMMAQILVIYACLTIGHSFNTHKILGSIGIYAGYSFVKSLLSTIVSTLVITTSSYGLSRASWILGINTWISRSYYNYSRPHFLLTFCVSLISSLVLGAVAFLLTNYFMSKRLNLE